MISKQGNEVLGDNVSNWREKFIFSPRVFSYASVIIGFGKDADVRAPWEHTFWIA